MEITLTTPSLLFPAISLLLLAYTNRFLGLASVIRTLHANYKTSADPIYLGQIHNLRRRICLIRDMQLCGVLSILLCTVAMLCLFQQWMFAGKLAFGASLVLMILSLALSAREIHMSVGALDLQLRDLEKTVESRSDAC
jgi:hypothetical protein